MGKKEPLSPLDEALQTIKQLERQRDELLHGAQSDRRLIEKLQAENRLHLQYARIIQTITDPRTSPFERI